jgi:hypothetical protein
MNQEIITDIPSFDSIKIAKDKMRADINDKEIYPGVLFLFYVSKLY